MIRIDLDGGVVMVDEGDETSTYPLDSPQAFATISRAWLRCGWDTRYVYGFTWMGRPVIQLPEDMIRIQEAIYQVKPDLLIETGVAHGGSLIFYASLFQAMGRGRVIGVDIEIRPHNRKAIESHELFDRIALIEGSSIDPGVVQAVKARVRQEDRVMVMLDSCHTKAHVLAELEAYAGLVSVGSYIVAADGIMGDLHGAPRTAEDWVWNNPREAALEFVRRHPNFEIVAPVPPFNEGAIREPVTYWPGGWIRRNE